MSEIDLMKSLLDFSISAAVIYMLFRLLVQTIPNSTAIQNLSDAIHLQAEQQAEHNTIIINMCLKMGEMRKEKNNASDD
jgi:hypothetical protein